MVLGEKWIIVSDGARDETEVTFSLKDFKEMLTYPERFK